ncbi:hypothetical protein ANTQUA_LOCUS2241 [Anthophora quadrimaculata]
MFVNYEKCCHNWAEIKRALRLEFSQVIDVHKIHKELSRRIKRSNETYQEYIYHMLGIAKQADMEVSAVIKYIVDGVQDEESNKMMILYGAKSIRELKEKFESYKAMKENSRTKSRRTEEKTKKTIRGVTAQESVRRCFLCGDRNHLSERCPMKSKGIKCFQCREYGHVASECNGVKKPVKDVSSTSEESRKKRVKDVQIEHLREDPEIRKLIEEEWIAMFQTDRDEVRAMRRKGSDIPLICPAAASSNEESSDFDLD